MKSASWILGVSALVGLLTERGLVQEKKSFSSKGKEKFLELRLSDLAWRRGNKVGAIELRGELLSAKTNREDEGSQPASSEERAPERSRRRPEPAPREDSKPMDAPEATPGLLGTEKVREPASKEEASPGNVPDFEPLDSRWFLTAPPYEINEKGDGVNPYLQNRLKGDYPIVGEDIFLALTFTEKITLFGISQVEQRRRYLIGFGT